MINVDVYGLEEAQEILAHISALGNIIEAAEVQARKRLNPSRTQPNLNNADVLKYMAEQNTRSDLNTERDFYTMNEAEQKNIVEKPFMKGLVKGIERYQKTEKKRLSAIATAISQGNIVAAMQKQMQYASQIMGNSLKAACKSYLQWVSDNIEEQNWKGGGGDLTTEYGKRKQRKHGFTHPIGKATGQVFDNVAPSSKNIKLIKNK